MNYRSEAQLRRNEAKVLDLVNRIRAATHRKPLSRLQRAFPGDNQACVIAKALKPIKAVSGVASHGPDEAMRAWGDDYATFTFSDEETARKVGKAINQPVRQFDDSEWDVRLPKYAADFIEDFDLERYPHLITKASSGASAFGA